MDFKQTSSTPGGMRLNPDASGARPDMPVPTAALQLTQSNLDLYSSPILIIYDLHRPPDESSASGISDRGFPPSYEEAIDRNAPPPSYDTLFGRIRETRKSRRGVFDFLRNVLILLLGSLGCTIILGITCIIPISMIIIGGLYLYDCPQGEYIPVYLLVGGAFGVFKQLLHICSGRRQRRGVQDEEIIRQSSVETFIDSLESLIECFLSVWFIIGSIWVYKEYEPNYDPSLGKYCNKTLYLFAFWLITISYIILLIVVCIICIFLAIIFIS